MKTIDITYTMKTPLFESVIFVDGLARGGKMLTSEIMARLERVDYFQSQSTIDAFCYMWFVGGVSDKVAVPTMQFMVDEMIYSRAIGRHLNTRIDDHSSVLKSPDVEEYVLRTASEDGMKAVDRFNEKGRIPVFMVHNVLPMSSMVLDALPYANFVHSSRHPVDQTIEWDRRGWGAREVLDPLSFVPLVETAHGSVPWFAADWAERYKSLNDLERAVESVLWLQKLDDDAHSALSDEKKAKVYRFSFEHLVTDPHPIIDDFCKIFDTQRRENIDAFLKQENCPRVLGPVERRPMLDKIQTGVGEETLLNLLEASRRYEECWGIEPLVP